MRTISARSLALLLGSDPLPRPAYRGLADGIRRLVSDGRLLVGTRLPSERALTTELGLSRTTVGDRPRRPARRGVRGDPPRLGQRRLPSGRAVGAGAVAGRPHPHRRPTRRHRPHVCRPPGRRRGHRGLRAGRSSSSRASSRPPATTRAGSPRPGPPSPPGSRREACRPHPNRSSSPRARTAACRPSCAPSSTIGDRVLVESPTYPNAIVGVRRSAYRAVAAQLTASGWDVDAIEVGLRQSGARAAYLIPDHQNPTGLVMDTATRHALGAVLSRANVVPVVDETFVELGLDENAGVRRAGAVRRLVPADPHPRQRRQDVVGRTAGRLGAGSRGWSRGRHRGPAQPRPRHGDPRAARRHRPAPPG